jgi:hypothetical protein
MDSADLTTEPNIELTNRILTFLLHNIPKFIGQPMLHAVPRMGPHARCSLVYVFISSVLGALVRHNRPLPHERLRVSKREGIRTEEQMWPRPICAHYATVHKLG